MIAERVITQNHRKDDGELDISLLQTRYSTLRPTRVTSVKLTWFQRIGNLWRSRRPYAFSGIVHGETHCCYLGALSHIYTVIAFKTTVALGSILSAGNKSHLIYFTLVAERKLHYHVVIG